MYTITNLQYVTVCIYYIPSNVIYYITLDSWYISASTKLKVSLNPEDLKLIPRYGLWISDLATAWSRRRRSQKSGRIVLGRAPQTEVGKASIVGWFPQRTKAPFRLWGVPSHVWLPERVGKLFFFRGSTTITLCSVCFHFKKSRAFHNMPAPRHNVSIMSLQGYIWSGRQPGGWMCHPLSSSVSTTN